MNKVIDTFDTTATIILQVLFFKYYIETNMKSLNVIHKTFNGFNKFSIIIDLMFLGIISIVHFLCYVENLIFFFFCIILLLTELEILIPGANNLMNLYYKNTYFSENGFIVSVAIIFCFIFNKKRLNKQI